MTTQLEEKSIFTLLSEQTTFEKSLFKEGEEIFLMSLNSISANSNYSHMPEDTAAKCIIDPRQIDNQKMASFYKHIMEGKQYEIINTQNSKHIKKYEGFTLLRKSKSTNQMNIKFDNTFFIETANEAFKIADTIHGEFIAKVSIEEKYYGIDLYLKVKHFSIMEGCDRRHQSYHLVTLDKHYPYMQQEWFINECFKAPMQGSHTYLIPDKHMPF